MDWESLWKHKYVAGFRRLAYIVTPNETSFKDVQDVPSYVGESTPYFIICIALECLVLALWRRGSVRINDGVNSITHGILSSLHKILVLDIELSAYTWVYDNFCIYPLPWNSPLTWAIAMIGVDFFYYWLHRLGHEVNIMWAGHQVHHSSEDYNLTTALRQSAFHRYLVWMFYLPLAFFIPPSQFHVHVMLNLLYQFWIHTEMVGNLGPLELILNTPSHHRVHHGRNPYCIDKNYGGTLIIWDRLFGTFEPEGEKVVYGLVHPLKTWDPIYGQVYHFFHILQTFLHMDNWSDRLSVLWKGPGWIPGKPRLGDPKDIPRIEHPVTQYDSKLPRWGNLYVLMHFTLIVIVHGSFQRNRNGISAQLFTAYISALIYSLITFGVLFDNRSYGPLIEFIRCTLCFSFLQLYQPISFQLSVINAIYFLFLASSFLWSYIFIVKIPLAVHKEKML